MDCVVMEPGAPKPVLTKRDFATRYEANEFGNRAPTWNSYEEWRKDHGLGLFHIRNKVTGGETWYNVLAGSVGYLYYKIVNEGKYKPEDLYFSAMAPTAKTIFQGEVFRSYRHLSLFYSCLPLTMREGLAKDGKQVYGLEASLLLKHYLDMVSYNWLQHLLDTYDEHVIEFSTYGVKWGTVPGMNTIYWEVRKY